MDPNSVQTMLFKGCRRILESSIDVRGENNIRVPEHKKSARDYCARDMSVLSPQPFVVLRKFCPPFANN